MPTTMSRVGCALALVAALLSGLLVVATTSSASAATAVAVSLSPRGEIYNPKKAKVSFTSTVSYGKKGTRVRLQRLGKTWSTVKTVKLTKTGRQTVKFGATSVRPGRWEYRVVTSKVGKYAAGNSAVRTSQRAAVHRVTCDNTLYARKPTSGVSAFFSRPSTHPQKYAYKRSVALANGVRQAICSAASGATIKVAMWHLADDSLDAKTGYVSNRILQALDYVSRYRKVKVQFVFDGRTGMRPATRAWLTQLSRGHLTMCKLACMSDRAYTADVAQYGDQHSKFVTISRTSGNKTAIVSTSSNWSYWQLRDYWNNAVVVWNDPALHTAMSTRFDDMVASARRATLAAPTWKSALVKDANLAWAPASANEIAGGAASVSFSPLNRALDDPLLDRLDDYSCVGAAGSVKVAVLFASAATGKEFAEKLDALRTSGCDVQVVISKPVNPQTSTPIQTDASTYALLKAALGADLRCATWMHSKNYLVDAPLLGTEIRQKMLWSGARNMNQQGTFDSDEQLIRSSSAPLFSAFSSDFGRIWSAATACPATWSQFTNLR